MSELYIGLMSGTSIDSLDAGLLAFNAGTAPIPQGGASIEIPKELSLKLHELCSAEALSFDTLERVKADFARLQAKLIGRLLQQHCLKPADIRALGSHGQTVRHVPSSHYSVQLNQPAVLAELTGIDVVADFRSSDLAAGGEGAPLTPLFHRLLLSDPGSNSLVLNLGGIANLTVIDKTGAIRCGFDTGPANTLLDLAMRTLSHGRDSYDKDGRLSASGYCDETLLQRYLSDPYFAQRPPKSTGREKFNAAFIAAELEAVSCGALAPADLLCTLSHLTVRSVCDAIAGL